MIYDLTQLTDWTRRSAGDVITKENETLVGDGTNALTLNNDGYISVTSVLADLTQPLASGDYSQNSNIITTTNPTTDGSSYLVTYDHATYDSSQIVDFIVDAARNVGAELHLKPWKVDTVNAAVDDIDGSVWIPDPDKYPTIVDSVLETLIVLRAAINIMTDKANVAAGDAAQIKNDDTVINTAVAAKASETALKRVKDQYKENLQVALTGRFSGQNSELSSEVYDGPPYQVPYRPFIP